MKIDHVHFYSRNAAGTRDWFIHNLGFQAIGSRINRHTHTELIALKSVFFVISSPLNSDSPVANYLNLHPSGVADIAFRVEDLPAIINQASFLGREILVHPQTWHCSSGKFRYAKILGWNDLQHTLVEENENTRDFDYCLPNINFDQTQVTSNDASNLASNITNIDHVVLNVASGKLDAAVKLYQTLFGWKIQQSFNIQTERSGLSSQALIDDSGEVQFNINEPTAANSQIQEFIDLNRGSGIQHLALRSHNLLADIDRIQQNSHHNQSGNLSFLTIPQAYYSQSNRLTNLTLQEWKAIAEKKILVDSDRYNPRAILMQIFTQPIFEQPTFFLEFIERRQGAKGFGQGNFKALFQAVEREQVQRQEETSFNRHLA